MAFLAAFFRGGTFTHLECKIQWCTLWAQMWQWLKTTAVIKIMCVSVHSRRGKYVHCCHSSWFLRDEGRMKSLGASVLKTYATNRCKCLHLRLSVSSFAHLHLVMYSNICFAFSQLFQFWRGPNDVCLRPSEVPVPFWPVRFSTADVLLPVWFSLCWWDLTLCYKHTKPGAAPFSGTWLSALTWNCSTLWRELNMQLVYQNRAGFSWGPGSVPLFDLEECFMLVF